MLATTFHLEGFRDWFMPLGEGSSRPVTPSLWSSPSCRVPCRCCPPGPNSGTSLPLEPFSRTGWGQASQEFGVLAVCLPCLNLCLLPAQRMRTTKSPFGWPFSGCDVISPVRIVLETAGSLRGLLSRPCSSSPVPPPSSHQRDLRGLLRLMQF